MPSSRLAPAIARSVAALAAAVATTFAAPSAAHAQKQLQGFAVERLYMSAPGGGWIVMDDLAMRGGLGGAFSLATGYAYKPLVLTDGTQHLAVVKDQGFIDVGAAVSFGT